MRKLSAILIPLILVSCNQNIEDSQETDVAELEAVTESTPVKERVLSQEFKDYWYDSSAEISSYDLDQVRYGENRKGTSVMVFVTEPFDKADQIKADRSKKDNVPVLKLNATSEFITGIYPYHVMSSTFLPLDTDHNAIKVAGSIQEWCGQTYMQLNRNNDSYQAKLLSYFQSEGNRDFVMDNQMLENQIPVQLRLGPEKMPTGELEVIPSVEFLRLKHVESKPYKATVKLSKVEDSVYLYSVRYTNLGRTISYKVEQNFPHRILSWIDRYNEGGEMKSSIATLKKTIKSAYWNKNSNADQVLRDSLAL